MIDQIKKGFLLPSGKVNIPYVKTFHKNATKEMLEWFELSIGNTLAEKIYIQERELKSLPTCFCGNPLKFISYKEGYREYCCGACRQKGMQNKIMQTCLKKYGTKSPAQSKIIQDKMKATSLKRFGVENIFEKKEYILHKKVEKYKKEGLSEIGKKAAATSFKRHGNEPKQKAKKTNLERYGHECSLHGEEIQKKVKETKKSIFWERLQKSNRLKGLVEPLFSLEDYKGTLEKNQTKTYPWKCKACQKEFEDYLANGHIPRCPNCYPYSIRGSMEKDLYDWLKNFLPGESIDINTRRIIPPLEIDIYFPDRKLGIEFDEIFWHSFNASKGVRNEKYHLNKTEECKKLGIHLLHVWETEWWNTPEIVKSIIKTKLGLFDKKIGARKCIIKNISSDESKVFLTSNHIQGYAAASIRLGLFYEDELVAHLAIGKNRFRPNTYEIVRFASKLNTSVQGGLTKLWKEALTQLPDHFTALSYVDRRYFEGKSNEQIGFVLDHTNPPGLHYTKDYKRLESRLLYQKHKLAKRFPETFDPNLTEWENMQLQKYDKIFDCGTYAYKFEK